MWTRQHSKQNTERVCRYHCPSIELYLQSVCTNGTAAIGLVDRKHFRCIQEGRQSKAENYRPISLTSVAYKLIEHIICRHLRDHLEKHNILSDRNHSFRSGHSCETQLLTTMHDLFRSNDAGIQADVVILDFSKALDTVPHNKLLHKLDHYGVRGPVRPHMENKLLDKPQNEGSPGR